MIAFSLLANTPIHSPASLRNALAELSSSKGEHCEGHLDIRLDLAMSWHKPPSSSTVPVPDMPWMLGSQALAHFIASGMPLVWKVEDMGQADLFLYLPKSIDSYVSAWSRFEALILGFLTPASPPEPRNSRSL